MALYKEHILYTLAISKNLSAENREYFTLQLQEKLGKSYPEQHGDSVNERFANPS